MRAVVLTIVAAMACQLHAGDPSWAPTRVEVVGRRTEVFRHGIRPEWGYAKPQTDSFVVVHPVAPRKQAPLYVVLHSAGHDVWKAVHCTRQLGNHDIHRAPDDFYALYLASPECLKTRFTIPATATADVSLRRLQNFTVKPGETLAWQFGEATGQVTVDAEGLITLPGLTISSAPQPLVLTRR